LLPRPRAETGAEQLEICHNDERADEHQRVAPAQQEEREAAEPERAEHVVPR